MKLMDALGLWAAQTKFISKYIEPKRDTIAYPAMKYGGAVLNKPGGMVRVQPFNLRAFSRTPYVRRAINAIKQPICKLEWQIKPIDGVKTNSEIKRQIAIATQCLKFPNNQTRFKDLLGLSLDDYLTFGSIAIEQQLGNDENRPLWLFPVDTRSIQVYPAWAGGENEARYVQTLNYANVNIGDGRQLRDDELIYIKANESNEAPFGWGAVQIAYNAIANLIGSQEFAGKLASNMYPSFMFIASNWTDADVNGFRSEYRNGIEGQGSIPLISMPKSAGNLQKSFEKLDFNHEKKDPYSLQWQEACIREIGAAFNLSPQNLNLERDVNRNTSEVAEDRDWDQTITPLAREIESAITFHALQKKLGFYNIEFEFMGLEREDEESTAKIYEKNYKNNAITPNEYRAKIGMQPLKNEWADRLYVDTQVVTEAARGSKVIADKNIDLPQQPALENDKADEKPKINDSLNLVSDKDAKN